MDQDPACAHYWEIAPPDGPTSKGKSNRYGAERLFENAPMIDAFAGGSRSSPRVPIRLA
jgi:hypothetical protein